MKRPLLGEASATYGPCGNIHLDIKDTPIDVALALMKALAKQDGSAKLCQKKDCGKGTNTAGEQGEA